MKKLHRLLASAALLVSCADAAFAQNRTSTPPVDPNSRQVRPLALNQTRYRLRAGERTRIDALPETFDFLRSAKASTVTIGGVQARGFAEIGRASCRERV